MKKNAKTPGFEPAMIVGKKVEVIIRLFDFERNMVFIFLLESCTTHPALAPLDEICRVSKFDNFLSFGAKKNAL